MGRRGKKSKKNIEKNKKYWKNLRNNIRSTKRDRKEKQVGSLSKFKFIYSRDL